MRFLFPPLQPSFQTMSPLHKRIVMQCKVDLKRNAKLGRPCVITFLSTELITYESYKETLASSCAEIDQIFYLPLLSGGLDTDELDSFT